MDDLQKGIGRETVENRILTISEAEEYAFQAIQGSDKADIVVLGRFDAMKDVDGNTVLDAYEKPIPSNNSYNIIAQDMDAQYFELDNWDALDQYIKKIYGR